jgi:hypothetical protein
MPLIQWRLPTFHLKSSSLWHAYCGPKNGLRNWHIIVSAALVAVILYPKSRDSLQTSTLVIYCPKHLLAFITDSGNNDCVARKNQSNFEAHTDTDHCSIVLPREQNIIFYVQGLDVHAQSFGMGPSCKSRSSY